MWVTSGIETLKSFSQKGTALLGPHSLEYWCGEDPSAGSGLNLNEKETRIELGTAKTTAGDKSIYQNTAKNNNKPKKNT